MNPATPSKPVRRSRRYSPVYGCSRGFMEVETPMMQAIPCGASARPFITHHNALIWTCTRVSRRTKTAAWVASAASNAYSEIKRNFRNRASPCAIILSSPCDGIPYMVAYVPYKDLIELTESLFRYAGAGMFCTTRVPYGDV